MTFNSHNLRGGGRIFDAIDHDDVALVRKLAGDPLEFAKRRNRMSPLMYAAYASRLEAVHVLLEAGADPNEIYSSTRQPSARLKARDDMTASRLFTSVCSTMAIPP